MIQNRGKTKVKNDTEGNLKLCQGIWGLFQVEEKSRFSLVGPEFNCLGFRPFESVRFFLFFVLIGKGRQPSEVEVCCGTMSLVF